MGVKRREVSMFRKKGGYQEGAGEGDGGDFRGLGKGCIGNKWLNTCEKFSEKLIFLMYT